MDDILKELLKMPVEELVKIRKIADKLIEEKSGQKSLSQEEKLFLEEIVKVLQKNGKIIHSLRYVRGQPNIIGFDYEEFRKAYETVSRYIEDVFGEISLPRKLRFYHILVSACYSQLVEDRNNKSTLDRLKSIRKILKSAQKKKGHVIIDNEKYEDMLNLCSEFISDKGIGIKAMLKGLQDPCKIMDEAFPGYGYNQLFLACITN